MKPVLIACERTQTETRAFRAVGIEAYSCDIEPCTKHAIPEWHIQCDALEQLIRGKWGLIIAHPPCTYLTACGATIPDTPERIENRKKASEFFMQFFNFRDCPMAIENPRPLHKSNLPPYDQVVDPTQFGSSYTKRTCLWLYDLPPLLPTHAKPVLTKSWVASTSGFKRSHGFPELATAYVSQWSRYILN